MKKLIGALALAAIVATSAFAEVTFGAWIATLPTLIGFDGEDVKGAGISNSWGWGARTARLNVNWASDDGKAGMSMGIYNDMSNGLGAGDDAIAWFKPVDALKITVGQMDNFTGTRGDLCYGSWNWLRPNTWYVDDEGLTFSALGDGGIGLQVFPVDGLQIYASLPLTEVAGKSSAALSRMDKAFGNGKIGAAYTIDGIGTIKAQFLGQYSITDKAAGAAQDAIAKDTWYVINEDGTKTAAASNTSVSALSDAAEIYTKKKPSELEAYIGYTGDNAIAESAATAASTYKKYGTIEAAFDLTGIDQLFVTFGAAFTIADSKWFAAQTTVSGGTQVKLALGASYGITEAFKVSGSFAAFILSSELASHDPAFQFGVGLDFAATEALGIVADVRMLLPNNSADPTLSFLVGAQYAIGSNASLGLGFQGVVGLGDKATAGDLKVVQATEKDKFAFAVPIRASIWF